eukprot:TRINITY_DN3282_c0_g1_i6.p1 TRINITY_DN3282_c0_g1~~TRINITY_DN3282_c0_g1_i6.p1  ORF type:complete len:900 (-),score=192.81 TRINITY_DN3282_c0_g1_i6:52-2490(-)
MDTIVGGLYGLCSSGPCVVNHSGGPAYGLTLYNSVQNIVDQVDIINLRPGDGNTYPGRRTSSAGFVLSVGASSDNYLTLVPESVATILRFQLMTPCLRPCSSSVIVNYTNIQPVALVLRNTVAGVGVYYYTGLNEVAIAPFVPFYSPSTTTPLYLPSNLKVKAAFATFVGVKRVSITQAELNAGTIGTSSDIANSASPGQVAVLYITGATEANVSRSTIANVKAGTGVSALDMGTVVQTTGGNGGDSYGVLVSLCARVTMSQVNVTDIKGGDGGTAETQYTEAGKGGIAFGVMLDRVNSSTFDTVHIGRISGGNEGRLAHVSCMGGPASPAVGLMLEGSNLTVTTRGDFFDIASGFYTGQGLTSPSRTVSYASGSRYDVVLSTAPSPLTYTTSSFRLPGMVRLDYIMFTQLDTCIYRDNSAVVGTTDTTLSQERMLQTIWRLGADGAISLAYPLPVGTYRVCYMPPDFVIGDPLVMQTFRLQVVDPAATTTISSTTVSTTASSSTSSSSSSSSSVTEASSSSTTSGASSTSSSETSSSSTTASDSSSSASSSSLASSTTSSYVTTTGVPNNSNTSDVIVQPRNTTLNVTVDNVVNVNDTNNKPIVIVAIPLGSFFGLNASTGAHAVLVVTSPLLPKISGLLGVVSAMVDLKISIFTSDSSKSNSTLSTFREPISITFTTSDDEMDTTTTDVSRLCLGYFDEVEKRWVCEDRSLRVKYEQGRRWLTGVTRHFTSFAVLLSADKTSSSSTPAQEDETGMMDAAWQPGGTSFIAVVVCVAVVVAVALTAVIIVAKRRQHRRRPRQSVEIHSVSSL